MNYETKMKKDRDGTWNAITEIDLGQAYVRHEPDKIGRRVLRFRTSKNSYGKGVKTLAGVSIVFVQDGVKIETSAFSFAGDPDGDYHATVCNDLSVARGTEKAIKEAHERAFSLFAQHIAIAKNHYKINEMVAA